MKSFRKIFVANFTRSSLPCEVYVSSVLISYFSLVTGRLKKLYHSEVY